MTTYVIHITLTNETKGHIFAEFDEDLDERYLNEDGTPHFGKIYRQAQDEYGACRSSVYVDRLAGGPPRRIGWFFVSRQRYTDDAERYLRGAWVTLAEVMTEARPRVLSRVEIST